MFHQEVKEDKREGEELKLVGDGLVPQENGKTKKKELLFGGPEVENVDPSPSRSHSKSKSRTGKSD